MRQPKPKKCKECGNSFTPYNSFQKCCGVDCALAYAATHTKKEVAKEKRKALKSFSDSDRVLLRAKAQKLVNKYARLRDQLNNGIRCCTCGIKKGKMDGGHFLPTSSYSSIRYNVNQIHQQCVGCNQFRHGMPGEYRIFMVDKYGEEYVKSLESTKGITRSYSTEYLQRLIKILSKRIKRIENMLQLQ